MISETSAVNAQDIRKRLSVILAAKYRIQQQLGAGGMATVWLARHRGHGALFAIKVLHPAFAEVPELRDAFHREALHTAALAGHPGIVPVFDIDQADGLHYLVMPYIHGWDLDEALHRCGRFSVTDTLTIALEIAKTLAWAEERGILHGDLALGNIRIDHFGRLLVLDFGLSPPLHVSASNAGTHFRIGTPYAMSPERIRGEHPDIRSDLYSLGVILFHVATGRPLFESASIEELEQLHLHGAVLFADAFQKAAPGLCNLLSLLLDKSPGNRPKDSRAVVNELTRIGAVSRPLDVTSLFPDISPPLLRQRLSSATG